MANKENNELEKRNQDFLIYQDENGIARVNVRFEGEDVWLIQEQMMELFDASRQDVSYHINQIYAEGECAQGVRNSVLLVDGGGNFCPVPIRQGGRWRRLGAPLGFQRCG